MRKTHIGHTKMPANDAGNSLFGYHFGSWPASFPATVRDQPGSMMSSGAEFPASVQISKNFGTPEPRSKTVVFEKDR